MIEVKILAIKTPQMYAVKRAVLAAQEMLYAEYPGAAVSIVHIRDWQAIETYTCVLSWPSLLVNGKLVCIGRFPSKDEVAVWLRAALAETRQQAAD